MAHDTCGPAAVVNGVRQDCECGVWDNAFLHAESIAVVPLEYPDTSEAFANGAEWAARWCVAIIGMAEAIRDAHAGACPACPACRSGIIPDRSAEAVWRCTCDAAT